MAGYIGKQAVVLSTTAADVNGNADIDGTVTANGLSLGDSDAINLGDGNDLQLYHDGSNSYIYDGGTGYMVLMSNGPGIRLNSNTAEVMVDATPNGAVSLYYDNSTKLATTSTGVDVTGTVTANGIDLEGSGVLIKAGATNSVDRDVLTLGWVGGVGDYIDFNVPSADDESGTLRLGSNGNVYFYEDTGTTPKFFWDASAERLGIGTTTPSQKLNVVDASGSGTATQIASGTTNSQTRFAARTNNYNGIMSLYDSGGTEDVRISADAGIDSYINNGANVGIGTNDPTEKLHVDSGDILLKSEYDATGTTDSYMFIANRSGGNWRNSYIGGEGADLIFGTGGAGTDHDNVTEISEAMRIDSSGNVGIGTDSPAIGLDVVAPTGNRNSARFTPNGSPNGQYIGITTCHANANGAGAGWETGAIGVNIADGFDATTNKPKINNTSGGWDAGAAITLSPNDGSIQFYNADGGSAGTVLSERMRVTTNGLTFNGDTAAANALDDYEEGTWTPRILGSGTAGTPTHVDQHGRYTKVGNTVHVWCRVKWSALSGATGFIAVEDLPFTSATTAETYAGTCMVENLNLSSDTKSLTTFLSDNATYVRIFQSRDNATWQAVPVDTAAEIRFQMTYRTS